MEDIRGLTTEIASGDPEAFARLYREKFHPMFVLARKTTGFGEDACLDVVQDAMMRVIRHIKPFDDGNALDRWLACLTRSVCFDHLRRERRRRYREGRTPDAKVQPAPVDTYDLRERLERVRRELGSLDRVAAAIVELRFRGGLTLEAIGRRLGLKAAAVHGRLTRAVAKLRIRTSDLGDD